MPVESLPEWVQPIAPISPVYWAMEGYRNAILDGGGVGDVARCPLAALVGFAVVFAAIALWRLRARRAQAHLGLTGRGLGASDAHVGASSDDDRDRPIGRVVAERDVRRAHRSPRRQARSRAASSAAATAPCRRSAGRP